jgi:hypothetical protein
MDIYGKSCQCGSSRFGGSPDYLLQSGRARFDHDTATAAFVESGLAAIRYVHK